MSLENSIAYILPVLGLVPIINSEDRIQRLAKLRTITTNSDGRRNVIWNRGIYFHQLQDLDFAIEFGTGPDAYPLERTQACYVKDLDSYIAGFPDDENVVREVFKELRNIGASFNWANSYGNIKKLRDVYNGMEKNFLRDWSHANK